MASQVVTGSNLVRVADRIPKFNVEKSCSRVSSVTTAIRQRDSSACERDEKDARSKLGEQWSHFTAAQRSDCIGLVSMGGPPSYVELLTCLEMAKQAAELPDEMETGTVGRR